MSGWEFVKIDTTGEKTGRISFCYGNTASTVENNDWDLDVKVKSKSELRAIREKLTYLGYEDRGNR